MGVAGGAPAPPRLGWPRKRAFRISEPGPPKKSPLSARRSAMVAPADEFLTRSPGQGVDRPPDRIRANLANAAALFR